MSKTMIRLTMTLLAVAAMFTLAGVAEAGHLAPRKAPGFTTIVAGEQGGLLSQALAWLTSLWTGEETHGTVEKTGSTGDNSTTNNTSSCNNPEGCEAGWGLDPNG